MTASLLDVARELYAAPGPAFVRLRAAAARAARAGGGPQAAAEVTRLPRPAPAAEALNHLLRADPTALVDVIAAGSALHAAHRAGSGAHVRVADERLRALVTRAAGRAHAVLADDGRASSTLLPRIEETVRAAAVDADATAAVLSGVLVRPLVATGLEPVQLDGAVAVPGAPALPGVPAVPPPARLVLVPDDGGPARSPAEQPAERGSVPDPPARRTKAPRPSRVPQGSRASGEDGRDAQRRRDAIVELADATRVADAASARADEQEEAEHEAADRAALVRDERDRTRATIDELTARLRELRDATVAAERELRRARVAAGEARASADAAARRRDAARRRLDTLGRPGR